MTSSRRRFLLASGAVATAGLAGCLADGSSDLPDDVPDTAVTNAPIPDSPGDYEYETMGTGEGPTVTYFGNWKCGHCSTFSTGALNTIVDDYVSPGDLNLQFRGISGMFSGDEPPIHAGLAVWNVDPENYWTYHEYVMENQPAASQDWATADWLTTAAEKAGVSDPDAVRSQVEGTEYQQQVSRTRSASSEAGVPGTPVLLVDGQVVSPMDQEGNFTQQARNALDQLASR